MGGGGGGAGAQWKMTDALRHLQIISHRYHRFARGSFRPNGVQVRSIPKV